MKSRRKRKLFRENHPIDYLDVIYAGGVAADMAKRGKLLGAARIFRAIADRLEHRHNTQHKALDKDNSAP